MGNAFIFRDEVAKIAAQILFFYSNEKRKAFRRRHSVCGYLQALGILGKYSEINGMPFIPCRDTRIGKFCSIAKNVSIGTGSHPVDTLTTHTIAFSSRGGDLKISKEQQCRNFSARKPVMIGHDVWIGTDVVIMDGVTIGTGAVIGANAVVTHDIPPYAIAVGVPA